MSVIDLSLNAQFRTSLIRSQLLAMYVVVQTNTVFLKKADKTDVSKFVLNVGAFL